MTDLVNRSYVRRHAWKEKMGQFFPDGLQGRTVLDCGCHRGYCLEWAKELGAGRCVGFDVRAHSDGCAPEGVTIQRCAIADFQPDDEFDIVLFQGLFYHLADPVHQLRRMAKVCRDLVIINTACRTDLPACTMMARQEQTSQTLSGIDGLHWFPSDDGGVFRLVLQPLGFRHFTREVIPKHKPGYGPKYGRIAYYARRATDGHDD